MDAPETLPNLLARRLLRAADRATLATRRRDGDRLGGWPYAALALMAVDHDASPLLLISGLAEHTKDIGRDDRVALMIDGTSGLDEPLTGARVTLLGRARRTDAPRHRARFLARHPGAAMYADFGDFGFYRVAVERAHLVGGFGRIHWIEGAALVDDTADAADLVEREADIVAHMNADHADALELYATRLLGQAAWPEGTAWRLTGVDPEGCDLRLAGLGGAGKTARLDFARRVTDAEQARGELMRLVKQARTAA
jgi:putative heme iron utilization protein